MKKLFTSLLAAAVMAVGCTAFAAADIGSGKLIAEGVGDARQMAPAGYRAAQMDAYRNMVEQVQGVQVDAESTVENFMLTNDVVKTKVNGLVKGAVVVDKFRDNDGYYHVIMEIPVFGPGSIAAAVLPVKPQVPFVEPEVVVVPAPTVEPPVVVAPVVTPVVEPVVPAVTTTTTTTTTTTSTTTTTAVSAPVVAAPVAVVPQAVGGYTGVIVDCSGLGLQTAMAPGIFTPDKKAIYGLENFSNEYAVSKGYVSYARSVTENVARAGSNPLVVKGVSVDRFCNPVISNEDAAKILAENKTSGFLAQGNVVFVR